MNKQWLCERCQRVLGTEKGSRMYLESSSVQFIIDPFSGSVLAICKCRTLNEWRLDELQRHDNT